MRDEWICGYACCLSILLEKLGINDTYCDELFKEGLGSIQSCIDAGVNERDIEIFSKYYK